MKLGFSVLHYQISEVTIDCVNSILKNIKEVEIVIVDNCSPNGSGNTLAEYFKFDTNVTCIQLDDNLGFAKGNNIGYAYLKDAGCDFICCVNNDTLITRSNFNSVLQEEYNKTSFAVFAPEVILKDKSIQSFNPILGSVKYYENELLHWESSSDITEYYSHKNIMTKLLIFNPKLGSLLRKIKQKFFHRQKKTLENVVLHGCFLVFSPIFVNQFDFAFNPQTFMYREEELLFVKVRLHNLKTVYSPSISIVHLEDLATDSIVHTKEEKFSFMKENQIASLNLLIDILKRLEEKGENIWN